MAPQERNYPGGRLQACPFEIVSRVRENSFKVRVDVNPELEVSGDRLKPEIPSPKGRVKPLFWTSKWLSERRIESGNHEVERLVDHSKDDEGNWRFLVNYKGFPESENTWEPPSSFVHGSTTGFRNYQRAHPEIPVLFTDCLSKPDRVVEKDGAKAVVVDRDPAPPPHIPAHSARNPAPQGGVRPEAPCPPPIRTHEGNEGRPVREPGQPDRSRGGGKPTALSQVVVRPHSETF